MSSPVYPKEPGLLSVAHLDGSKCDFSLDASGAGVLPSTLTAGYFHVLWMQNETLPIMGHLPYQLVCRISSINTHGGKFSVLCVCVCVCFFAIGKGDAYWKPPFLEAVLVSGRVYPFCFFFSPDLCVPKARSMVTPKSCSSIKCLANVSCLKTPVEINGFLGGAVG